MDLKSKFEAVMACSILKTNSLTPKHPFEIDNIERTLTKFGPSLIVTPVTSPTSKARVFLPRRYCGLFGDNDVEAIQKSVRLQLVYLGTDPISKSFDMAIEPINI
jgi:hypothetical protein